MKRAQQLILTWHSIIITFIYLLTRAYQFFVESFYIRTIPDGRCFTQILSVRFFFSINGVQMRARPFSEYRAQIKRNTMRLDRIEIFWQVWGKYFKYCMIIIYVIKPSSKHIFNAQQQQQNQKWPKFQKWFGPNIGKPSKGQQRKLIPTVGICWNFV